MNTIQSLPIQDAHPFTIKVLASLLTVVVVLEFSFIGQYFLPVQAAELPNSPEKALVELINQQRQAHQLNPLSWNSQLSLAAEAKAADMLANNYFDHYSPSGTSPWDFIKASHYTYIKAGENLAIDFSSPELAVPAWMNSPSHRANILKSSYEETGIAVVTGQHQGRTTTVIVQMFGTRPYSIKQLAHEVLPL